ncbi:Elf1-domain-containing protein [Wilcoxina mikolae CBS 423.85]|nr:Elf1-domain-containing protein [Wilcoxina mikolae CBS 423.85]
MGKRKKSSRKPQGPKKVPSFFPPSSLANPLQREPLSTTFNCLFCNHEDSVTCKLDKKGGVGSLSCKICGQQFQSSINCTQSPSPSTPATQLMGNRFIPRGRRIQRMD